MTINTSLSCAPLCGVAILMLSGCGGTQTIGMPAAMQKNSAFVSARTIVNRVLSTSSFRVLHRFTGSDGEQPYTGLIDVNGTLYGTTVYGGSHGFGTVYSITATGSEKLLYSFNGGSDGANPEAGLINVSGTLYGTTSQGGGSGCLAGYGCGTVYRVSTVGAEKVLHRFVGGADGANPQATLVDANGILYGTTAGGGSSKQGTVYRISTKGSEKILYSFAGGSDGAGPIAGLINVNGKLYGTTAQGGGSSFGTVFSISTTGTEKVLHSFAGGSDGGNPRAGLLDVKGVLYGTTSAGGGSGCPRYVACGTVYRITTGGVEKVLYAFTSGSDGASPYAGLTNVKGTLYGTTDQGGSKCSIAGCGTVYSITTTGSEAVLHSFAQRSGGVNPWAGLIDVNGTLYGTTVAGGSGCSGAGCGVVFALSP